MKLINYPDNFVFLLRTLGGKFLAVLTPDSNGYIHKAAELAIKEIEGHGLVFISQIATTKTTDYKEAGAELIWFDAHVGDDNGLTETKYVLKPLIAYTAEKL